MRKSLVWFGLAVFAAVSTVNSQSIASATQVTAPNARRVTVALVKVPLDQALKEISRQSGTKLIFDADADVFRRAVSLKAENMEAQDALSSVLAGTGLSTRRSSTGEIAIVRARSGGGVNGQGVIAGKVMDGKTGRGIPGARVAVENDSRAVTTSDDGTYRIPSIAAGSHTLTVRMVGYAKQSRSILLGEGATVTADFKLEPSLSVLDQVIVTGTVAQTELKAVPNAVTVITAKQIEERGITRIDQLFRGEVPGLFASNVGSAGLLDEVTMYSRGATALTSTSAGSNSVNGEFTYTNSMKTYIDGVEMADSRYLSQLDPKSIERIEILTGPQASTIYGSNAINGVMQVFTKRGTSAQPQLIVNAISGVAQSNSSSRLAPSHITDATLSGNEGRWSYNIASSWNYIGAWTPSKQTQRLATSGGARMDFGKFVSDISARRGLTNNKQIGNQSQKLVDLRQVGILATSSTQGVPQPQKQTLTGETYGLTLNYRPLSWLSNELVMGSDASATEGMRTGPGFTRPSDTTLSINQSTLRRNSQRYSTTMQLPMFALGTLNLAMGADHWRTSGTTWSGSPVSLTGTLSSVSSLTRIKPSKNTGAFVQAQFGIKDALFFTYGLRGDWNPNFGDDVKVKPGRYGVSYVHDMGLLSVKLRGSYGRAIRPPSEGYKVAVAATVANAGSSVLSVFGPFDTQLANPDLTPEDQQGGEGGVELYFGSRASLVATRYNQTVDNLISSILGVDSIPSLVPNPTDCSSSFLDAQGRCYRYQTEYLNVGSIRNQGWELTGNVNTGHLTTRGTYSWTKSRILGVSQKYRAKLNSSSFQPGRPFDFMPEHTWGLQFTYAQSASLVSISVNGIGMLYKNAGTGIADDVYLGVFAGRLTGTKPRMELNANNFYRPISSGYATADLNANHRVLTRVDATLQVLNLTNYYRNDISSAYTSIGRQTKLGLRFKL